MKKIKIEIKNRWTGTIQFEYSKENNTIKDTIEKAIICKADLRGADLWGADLRGANLRGANLRGANLRGADLCKAALCEADLCEADLRGADLCEADLCEAALCKADLRGADLCEANLRGANLRGANLRGANLRGADLCKAALCEADKIRKGFINKEKVFVYKKCHNKIVTLELQKGSIVFSINNYKCRTNKAKVIAINDDKTKGLKISSNYDSNFIYEVGKIIEVENFNLMYNVECSTGIHFFYKKEDAINYEN